MKELGPKRRKEGRGVVKRGEEERGQEGQTDRLKPRNHLPCTIHPCVDTTRSCFPWTPGLSNNHRA